MTPRGIPLPPGNCPFCDAQHGAPAAWGGSPEMWDDFRYKHDAGHPEHPRPSDFPKPGSGTAPLSECGEHTHYFARGIDRCQCGKYPTVRLPTSEPALTADPPGACPKCGVMPAVLRDGLALCANFHLSRGTKYFGCLDADGWSRRIVAAAFEDAAPADALPAEPRPETPMKPIIEATIDHPAIYRDGHRLTATPPAAVSDPEDAEAKLRRRALNDDPAKFTDEELAQLAAPAFGASSFAGRIEGQRAKISGYALALRRELAAARAELAARDSFLANIRQTCADVELGYWLPDQAVRKINGWYAARASQEEAK